MNDATWFWQIVDARGLADVSSDEFVALNELISKAERAETELDAVSAAIGSARFMDPPDGGDVSLSEQVRRMREALTTAESERDELLREKERLGAGWLPIETAPKDGGSYLFHDGVLGTIYGHWYDGDEEEEPCWFFFDWCGDELIGCVPVLWRPVPRASSALENGPAGLADANSKSPSPSSQSERIAVLEAAAGPARKAVERLANAQMNISLEEWGELSAAILAALAPLGEE